MAEVNEKRLTEVLEKMVRMTVRETVAELRKQGLLQSQGDISYKTITEKLNAYYAPFSTAISDEDRQRIDDALYAVGVDEYFEVIPLYFRDHWTIEKIAEELDREPSTITRNKKRLCLKIHSLIL